jgi:S-formylglutathione hydrolase
MPAGARSTSPVEVASMNQTTRPEQISAARSFGGTQYVFKHRSEVTGTDMRFAAFVPPQADVKPVPVVWFLSGLTCTEENFTVKAGAQRGAARLGLILIAPDTSPRGEGVPDDADKAYDFGLGAGFYLDATQEPWARNYRMESYIVGELPGVVAGLLPAEMGRQAVMGHSMGGHGAITLALKNPGRFASVSAFSPIASPMNCPWGEKALSGYLGQDRAAWRRYDSCALLDDGARLADLLVDQGTADSFLEGQLKPQLLQAACDRAGIPLTLRMQNGYDHSYFFIATFIEDHLTWHARRLGIPISDG